MFWKFRVEKPSHVLYKFGARHFEAEKLSNILFLPIIESYEQQSRLMRAEIKQLKAMKSIGQGIIQSHVTELRLARTEALQLRQEIQLLKTRWHIVICKYIPWKTGSSSMWPEKPSGSWRGLQGCLKGKGIGEYFRNATENILPAEFKPSEVRLGNFWLYLYFIILRLVQDHLQLLKLLINYLHWNVASYYKQIKFDVSGKELIIPLSLNRQPEQDDDGGYTHEIVQGILAAKDEGLVSDEAYHEIRMALPEHVRAQVPLLSSLLQDRKKST